MAVKVAGMLHEVVGEEGDVVVLLGEGLVGEADHLQCLRF